MSQISVSHLTFAYDGTYDDIFADVSFQLDTNWKLGFCGRNGRGKTTFLRLLMGELEYRGSITAGVRFEYFPYRVADPARGMLDILSGISPDSATWQIQRELSKLAVPEETLRRPFFTLSNGEQTKALLAALFLRENSFPLIDEPTNHLDMSGRETVARYLDGKSGFILVSHDRAFLDECVDHVLSINKAGIEIQSGNFSSWWQNKRLRDEYEIAENERLKKEISHLEAAARRAASWSDKAERGKIGFVPGKTEKSKGMRAYEGEKSRKLMARSKAIQERQQDRIDEKSTLLRNIEAAADLKLHPLTYHADRLLSVRDLSVSYMNIAGRARKASTGNAGTGNSGTGNVGTGSSGTGNAGAGSNGAGNAGAGNYGNACSGDDLGCDAVVFRGMSFSVHRGDRVALQGGNGCGKSSVLKLVCGEDVPHGGEVAIGSQMAVSYVPQDASFLSGALDGYANQHGLDITLFKAVLRQLDFGRAQFDKDMRDYSAGQKKKVLLARSMCQHAHLYVWDEPLNYVDVLSRMQIEELLLAFKPTMLFAEHDKAFCRSVATKTVRFIK